MTIETATPAADAAHPAITLSDLASQAYRVHYLVGGLDVINDAMPITYGDATPHEKIAMDAHTALIEVLTEKSRALALALERYDEDQKRAARTK
jgi:hypothetical protein